MRRISDQRERKRNRQKVQSVTVLFLLASLNVNKILEITSIALFQYPHQPVCKAS